jgi:hypothetical protein
MNSASLHMVLLGEYTPSHAVERTMEAVCQKGLVRNRLSCDLSPILDTRRSGGKFD